MIEVFDIEFITNFFNRIKVQKNIKSDWFMDERGDYKLTDVLLSRKSKCS